MRIKEKQYFQVYQAEVNGKIDAQGRPLTITGQDYDPLNTSRESIARLKKKYMR